MGVFIIAINDKKSGTDLCTSLRKHIPAFYTHHTCASDLLDHYLQESSFRPNLERKISCILFDSLLPQGQKSTAIVTGEDLAQDLRELNYTGILAHYGTRDLNALARKHVNVSGIRYNMTHNELVLRLKNAFDNPDERFEQNAQGMKIRRLPYQ